MVWRQARSRPSGNCSATPQRPCCRTPTARASRPGYAGGMHPAMKHPLAHGFAVLRPVQPHDLTRWLSYLGTDEVRQGISWRPRSTHELQEFVHSTDLRGPAPQVRFAIVRSDDDAMLGSIGLHSISLRHRSAEIGYDIAPEQWGQGLATAACRAIVAWARLQGFTRIQATVLVGNEASLRVLERAGFEREGCLRQYRWIDGRACDVLVYGNVPPAPPADTGPPRPDCSGL